MNAIGVVEACRIPVDVEKGKGRRHVFPIYHHNFWICKVLTIKDPATRHDSAC